MNDQNTASPRTPSLLPRVEMFRLPYDLYLQARQNYAISRMRACGLFSASDVADCMVQARALWSRAYWEVRNGVRELEDVL